MATRFDALEKLREKLMESHHDYRVSADTFPSLYVDKIIREMDLVAEGTSRGEKDVPPSNSKMMDEVELAIIDRIQEARKSAHQVFEDQLYLYSGRIASLGLTAQLGLLKQANSSSLTDFKGEIAVGLDTLHAKRTDLHEAMKELVAFRAAHKLQRVARINEGTAHVFRLMLLVCLFLIETYLNGSFLAKGSDQGMLGGITEAAAFSFVNIGSSLIFAIFCVRLVTHRSFFAKLIGASSIVAYAVVALGLNLLLAHYREVSGTLADGVGTAVIQQFLHNPFGLTDIKSWMLFCIGLLFSLIAFIDGWFVLDPYPGYAGVEKRRRERRQDYTDTKADLIDRLIELRDEHNAAVEDILKGLTQRQREHAAILSGRARLVALFAEHQDQLERTCNQLLTKYREANTAKRELPAPKYFAQPYKLHKSKPALEQEQGMSNTELSDSIKIAENMLNEQIVQIGRECELGIEKYRDLDKLYPETLDGEA